ncbi:caspase family protein [Trichocoleus sp. ST-U3]
MTRDALVVGINQYPFLKDSPTSKAKHLKTPAADAEAIAQLLEDCGEFRVRRLPVSNMDGKLQVDPNKQLTVQELEEAIAQLFLPESGKVPQTALLFFAGHGLRKQLGSFTQGFLATSDASPRKNQWGMPLRDLREILQESAVPQQVIWLDCCFSGELLNFKEADLGGRSSGRDRFFIAASLDYEVAYQQLDGEHGVLTGTLLKGLDPYQIPEYEWITDRTLALAVEQHLKAYYAQTKIPQTPLISNHGQPIELLQKRGIPQSEAKNKEAANNPTDWRVNLDSNIFNELVELLRPFMEDETSRRSFLVLALGNNVPVLQRITWGGSVATFIPHMVCRLIDYGEVAPSRQSLWVLLEYVRSQSGVDVQQRIEKLRPLIDLRSPLALGFAQSQSSAPTDTSSAIETSDFEILAKLGGVSQIRKAELTAEIRERYKEKLRFIKIKNKGQAEARKIQILINKENLISMAQYNPALWSDMQKISSIPAGEERTLRLGYTEKMRHQVSITWSDDSEEQGLFEDELIALIDY